MTTDTTTTRERIDFFPDEEWLEVRGNANYLISSRGRIYSTKSHRLLHPHLSRKSNRLRLTVAHSAGGNVSVTIVNEVLDAFGDEDRPRGAVAALRDGNPLHCRVENLYWVRLRSAEHDAALSKMVEPTEEETRSAVAPDPEPDYATPEFLPPSGRTNGTKPGGLLDPAALRKAQAEWTEPGSPERNRAIRDWAKKTGVKVAPRGRIPGAVIERFEAEHAPRLASVG